MSSCKYTMGYSAGIYSTLNQQMDAYRKERGAEEGDERRLRYKMLKKRAEEEGLDSSAQRVASMLERVSKVIEGPEDIGKGGPAPYKPEIKAKESAIAILLKAIRDKNLASTWKHISDAKATTQEQKQLQATMKKAEVKEEVNGIINQLITKDISESESAEMTYDTLKKSMPLSVPDSVMGEAITDLDSDAETADTMTTVAGEQGKPNQQFKTPRLFNNLLHGTYKNETPVYRKNQKGDLVQFLQGAYLYIVPENGQNVLKQRGNKGTDLTNLTPSQFEQLDNDIPFLSKIK